MITHDAQRTSIKIQMQEKDFVTFSTRMMYFTINKIGVIPILIYPTNIFTETEVESRVMIIKYNDF